MGKYQPYFLESEKRWVIGCGGTQSKAEVKAIVEKLNAEAAEAAAKKMDELIETRRSLASNVAAAYDTQYAARDRAHEAEDCNWYGAGDKYQSWIDEAEEKLSKFDAQHPDVLPEIRARKSAAAERNIWN